MEAPADPRQCPSPAPRASSPPKVTDGEFRRPSRRPVAEAPLSHAERVWDLVKTLIVSLSLAVVVRVGIAQAYEVDGPSMEPTLLTGEKLIVARCAYGFAVPWREAVWSWAMPQSGDVVILASPQNPREDLVKRVIGLPGDVIEVREDQIFRNGEPLTTAGPHACPEGRYRSRYETCETYVEASDQDHRWRVSRSLDWGQTLPAVHVPEGHIYVLGDHRTRSNDSRTFGPVPVGYLRGKVLFTH
jgi:signal peptidase I